MVKITFKLKKPLRYPTDLSPLIPEKLTNHAPNKIANIPLHEGNRIIKVKDLFTIKTEDAGKGDEVHFIGNFRQSRRIGLQMTQGVITVHGDGGLYLGEELNGGSIYVHGNTGSWTGTRMKDGLIEVEGNSEHYLGSSYRGSREGMKGGKILIHGSVGDETGCWLNGGIIHIKGSASYFTGIHMNGGTILVEQGCGDRAGAEMVAGTIIILGELEAVLPSFQISDIRSSAKIGADRIEGPFYMFEGDINENGQGRIYALKEKNLHLQGYEKYIGLYE